MNESERRSLARQDQEHRERVMRLKEAIEAFDAAPQRSSAALAAGAKEAPDFDDRRYIGVNATVLTEVPCPVDRLLCARWMAAAREVVEGFE